MRFLIVLSFFYLLSTVKTLELKNICKDDQLLYEEQQVNAYYHLKLEKTLPKLEFYYLEFKEDLKKAITIELAELLDSIKKRFNRLLFNVYSEKFLMKLNASDEIYQSQRTLTSLKKDTETVFKEVFDLHKESPAILHLHAFFAQKFRNFASLLDLLIDLKNDKIVKQLLPQNELHDQLIGMNDQLLPNQEPIFEGEYPNIYYASRLYKFNSFEFIKASKMFFSLKSYGKIYFSMYIPFYDSKYINDEDCTFNCDCTLGKDLPRFFKDY